MTEIFSDFGAGLLDFAFYYPLFMAYLWMIGGIYYYLRFERRENAVENPPRLPEYPPVTFIVPCHNEEQNVRETIENLLRQQYPDFEIIAVNDGSTDRTGEILDALSAEYPRVRVVHHATNQGKAIGLRTASLMTSNEYLICIDGDALLDLHAAAWLMRHFIGGPRVGAVTGNPRVRTRSTLLGRIQVGEFSSIIGLIKRAQRVYGRIFTVSGVVSAFRKSALHQAGYWSPDMLTEDIDVSWNLQLNHWDVRFEPNALCWVLMPETVRGLWRQRLRWAKGGAQVLIKNFGGLRHWRERRMWPVYAEYISSIFWAYSMVLVLALWALGKLVELPASLYVPTLLPGWNGVVIGVTCLLQFALSLVLDSRYEKGLGRYYYWIIWYPTIYWMLNVFTTVVALPWALLRRIRGDAVRAVWVSPDRGLRL